MSIQKLACCAALLSTLTLLSAAPSQASSFVVYKPVRVVKVLPRYYTKVIINNTPYYRYQKVYYIYSPAHGGYIPDQF